MTAALGRRRRGDVDLVEFEGKEFRIFDARRWALGLFAGAPRHSPPSADERVGLIQPRRRFGEDLAAVFGDADRVLVL